MKKIYYQIIIIAFSVLLFIPFNGKVHLFDWDEINFAESAREMIVSGDYLNVKIGFKPFWEKPPLFIWLQVLSMKIFGINEFASRFPNAICSIFTLLILFSIGSKLYSYRFGFIWVLSYMLSVLPFLYFKSGIIDPWFNLFIFLGIYYIFRYFNTENNKIKNSALSAFFIGLSMLTKGPVGLLITGLTVIAFIALKKFKYKLSLNHILIFAVILTITGGFWFILQIISGNFKIIEDFIFYQIRLFTTKDAGHGGFLLYHPVILFFGVFPASVFALSKFRFELNNTSNQNIFKQWMLIVFWIVLILFTIVKTKIVHYSSMCYFPITFLGALTINEAIENKKFNNKWQMWIIFSIGFIYCSLLFLLAFFENIKQYILSKFSIDEFTKALINADVSWPKILILFSGLVFSGFIIFIIYSYKQKVLTSFAILAVSVAVFIISSIILIVPRVELHSQNALIEFLLSIKDKDCYVNPIGMKSYAHYFYSGLLPDDFKYDSKWLLSNKVDKDAYFFMRDKKDYSIFEKYNDLKLIYKKYGYVFFVKKKENQIN
jgi:4-amino-4-deoxy-L-arabinose transferase-like glycosyltransferase